MFEFMKKAFQDMKESAAQQHQVDKAKLEAVRAESRAHFEENRGHNTLARARESSKKSWDETCMAPAQRKAQQLTQQQKEIAAAKARTAQANARYEQAKKH